MKSTPQPSSVGTRVLGNIVDQLRITFPSVSILEMDSDYDDKPRSRGWCAVFYSLWLWLLRSSGRAKRQLFEYDDTKHYVGYNDKTKNYRIRKPVENSYERYDDERERFCDCENKNDDKCAKQLKNRDRLKYANKHRRPLYFEKVHDSNSVMNPNEESNIRPVVFDLNKVEGCYDEDTAQGNIKVSYREPICVHDTDNEMHEQHRSDGIQNARSNNCSGCTQFKHNADHTCYAVPDRIERTVCKGSNEAQNERNLRNTRDEIRESIIKYNAEQERGCRERLSEYGRPTTFERRKDTIGNREMCQDDSENERMNSRDRINTDNLHDSRDIRASQIDISGRLLEQQTQLMNEMFRMMNTQHELLQDRTNDRRIMKVKPEKFSGCDGTSVYSFIAQFENCSEINQWNEREKILMLQSSLTGNALSILWHLGSNKDYSYEELVDMLKARYGSKGQMATYRLQLRTRRQSRDESLGNLMQDIRKLMALAYPGKMSELIEEIARDVFIEALYDRNLALQVLMKEPKSLDEAFQIATKLRSYSELVFQSDHLKNVRNSDNLKRREDMRTQKIHEETSDVKESSQLYTNPDEFKRMKDMILDLTRKMEEMKTDMERTNNRSRDYRKEKEISLPRKIICYECGKEGHRRFECPDKVSGRPTHQGGRTPADTRRRREWNNRDTTRNDETEEPRQFLGLETKPKHVNSAGEGLLYANLRVNGSMRKCLIDCGSEVSLIPVRMTKGLQRRESSRVLLAANNTPISMLGEVDVDIRVAGRILPITFLVSDQIDSTILGLDWLSRHSCKIDFESDILQVEEKQVQLHRSTQGNFCRRIMVAQDVEIPPNSEKDVNREMIYPRLKFHNDLWLTENKGNVPSQLKLAHTWIKDHGGEMKIRVLNITRSPIKLQAGRKLCSASLATEVVDLNQSIPEQPHSKNETEEEKAIQQLMGNVDPAIPQELKVRLEGILRKHIKAISMNEDDLGRTSLARHHIDTGNAPPVRQGMRRIPQAHAQVVDSQLENMIRQKLIQPSKSDFASNVVLVKKKDNTWRFRVDYRKVNDLTRKDAYPLPRIDECFDTLTASVWFTTIDLRSGYFQVEISEEDAHKTAFITRRGLYEFQVMPQGMCNSAVTFQRLMNLVLAGLNYEICLVYIDDIIIFSKDVNEHLDRLEVVLRKLEEAGLKIQPDKCKMLQREVHFLGHVISGEGIRTSPSKTEVVATWPVPTKVTELRSFIGLCSYYKRFIKDFAKTAKPLHALTGKYARFHWTPECQAAFDELKHKMITAPVVAFPRDDDTYILDCDASLESIGAVLSQIQDGEERVISYASRLFSKSESNYCVTRRELLAVVHFCKYYKQYLLGRHFIVRTDHSALTWLRKTPEPIGQRSRWLEQLEEFSFTVEHRSGSKHTNADAMSRRPCRQCHMCDKEGESNETEKKESTQSLQLRL